jgi:hypothetical protein
MRIDDQASVPFSWPGVKGQRSRALDLFRSAIRIPRFRDARRNTSASVSMTPAAIGQEILLGE